MNQSIQSRLITSVVALWVSGVALADPVFPPPHVHLDAAFAAGVPAIDPAEDAWYHDAESDTRLQRIESEAKQVSPYPALYYFINIRNYANDENDALDVIRVRGRVNELDVVATPADDVDPS